MYDLVYDFILNSFLNTGGAHIPLYYDELALLLTHTTLILFYVALVMLTIHLFNSFRSMTRFW
jgi:hypothetical protein